MTIEELMVNLHEIYIREDKGDEEHWNRECGLIREALEAIQAELASQYNIEKPVARGGAGIVIKVSDRTLQVPRALKIPRPGDQGKLDSVKSEMQTLTLLRHQHITPIYTLGEVAVSGLQYPFFVGSSPFRVGK